MSARKIVESLYKSDAIINSKALDTLLHADASLEWQSSKGLVMMNRMEMIALSDELSKAYPSSRIEIGHIVAENQKVAVRYSQYVSTIENPNEEMLLAHFMVVWELKDGKLFKCYQMSQLS
ncbi:nuclear transport factor 2 family protein [Flavobacterium ardleyense]|uniref:nuclear transport factor 2 family protein n=1 Tax=Flavobacterium ardleyense TaxID=2038737 RepID=UPI00298D3954|nr:nuclear transport factor 2 family protein [Flavobacterium ardleyense]